MVEKEKRLIIVGILRIFIDIFNIAEQLGIYFIAKDNDLDETAQQRFFFILFGVGGVSLFKPLFYHPVLQTIFSICIEAGELACYLTVLTNTKNLLIVAILFFSLEVLFHAICIACLCSCDENHSKQCLKGCCTLPLRIILYGTLFETQIFFLFLDASSPFRDTFYEVLMILATFFGLPMVEKGANKACRMEEESSEENDEKIFAAWEGLLTILGTLIGPIITVTAVIYCAQMLPNRSQYKTYDFAIYIITIISYGSILLSLVCCLGCTACLCAGTMLVWLKECLCHKEN
ncbi:unnamed protein product [Adineta ricciae]|uniref:Uncharacterized protein n=2 Tax=Adineta ricciae TaxID=249248 RepID=A0A815UZP5_ADIRI|nr:unnamed protein product [Adineta ricciae]